MRLRLGRLLRGRGLSARVFWLTVGIILLVEIAILVPSLGRERNAWLWDRVIDGHLAAYSEVMASQNGLTAGFDQQTQSGLLALSGNLSINLINPATHLNIVLATPGPAVAADVRVDLSRESLLTSAMRADLALLGLGGQFIEITAPAAIAQGVTVRVVVNAASLAQHLRAYAGHIALLSVMIALITGLLLFAALNRMLVKPLRIMTASIAGFRRDPEILRHDELDWLAAQREDEIAGEARELVVMQEELRAALWRNARLAAVGTAVAKISHDLRNILTSALLVADRLQDAADPAVKRAANTLIPAVERAAQLVSLTVDFAREGPPALIRSEVVLRELIEEAAIVVRP